MTQLWEILSTEQFLWTVVIASTCSLACAWLGCFLVLKRMSLLGDALGHGVLPGIVLAVLVSGQITTVYLLLGAMLFGLLTALISQSLHSLGQVSEDASLGVVFTTFFALGVVLIAVYVRHGDLDTDCVFMGHLDQAFAKVDEILPMHLVALALTLGFILLFWKELKIAVFDADLAKAMGFKPLLLHYLLIALVAGVTVVSFEAVGSILVLAMLIVPAATALLITDRLAAMFMWASAAALLSSFLGCLLAWQFNVNSAGMMAVVAGALFFLTVFIAPRHGILARIMHNAHLTLRIAGEDILAALYRAEESGTPPATLTQPEHGFSPLAERVALWRLRRKSLIAFDDGKHAWQLTDPGRGKAKDIVRAHRLWEAFLGENFQLPLDHLHGPAALMEHFIGPELQSRLAAELQDPAHDPHGKVIPEP